MSDLNLPPRREMPLEVRERLRDRVSLDPPRRGRFVRVRPPLAAAAVLAVLAAGAVVVATYGPEPAAPAGPRSVPTIDRCWNAVLAQGKVEVYPPFAAWRQVAERRSRTSTITSVLADGKPIFCVTNETSVVVSDPLAEPQYAQGTRTAMLLHTPDWFAGVADPAWKQVGVRSHEPVRETVAIPKEGLFVATALPPSFLGDYEAFGMLENGQAYPGPGKGILLRDSPPPAIRLYDNPGAAPALAKMFLANCIGNAPNAPTHLLWHAGVLVGGPGDNGGVVMARGDDHVGMCRRSNQYEHVFTDLGEVPQDAPRLLVPAFRFESVDGPRWVILGVVPKGTTSMRVTLAGGDTVRAMVANGTFALELPPDSADEEGKLDREMVPRDAVASGPRNDVLYDGPLLDR